jgi:prepilin-type N-terminal cleavage/methylation domain-containing protein
MNKNKGFTLIELMVVIAIIAVLAAIVLGLLNSSKAKGNDSKVVSQLKSMVNQAQLFTGPSINPTNSWSTWPVSDFSLHSHVGLFWNDNSASNSLYRLASSLPSGTVIYYSEENKLPLAGGRWAIAASTSTGSFCVDYTGVGKAKNTGSPMVVGTASGQWPNLQSATNPAYSCN